MPVSLESGKATEGGLKTGQVNKIVIEHEVVPIIFVPGIMGSRLQHGSEKRWDPDAPFFMLSTYGLFWVDPFDKKEKLVGERFSEDFLTPINDDKAHNDEKFGEFKLEHIPERGWGGISWSSYGPIIEALHLAASGGNENPALRWSDKVLHKYRLPVYAFGYNWTASNEGNGKKLADFIDATIKRHVDLGRKCTRVILVTHSMGGLVARAACHLGKATARVLGIVHGVQPVTGAGAAYWRIKCGFERKETNDYSWESVKAWASSTAAAWVLGTNGEETTALLANMPGGLQLLPNCHYQDNDGDTSWINFVDQNGQLRDKRPKTANVYQEIYREQDAYWRLVDPNFLSPTKDECFDGSLMPVEWSGYLANLSQAEAFHKALSLWEHPDSRVFYGSGHINPTPDRVVYALSPHGWKEVLGKLVPSGLKATAINLLLGPHAAACYIGCQIVRESDTWQLRGGYRTYLKDDEGNTIEVTLKRPVGDGDGTVPESSARALQGASTQAFPGVEHEPAYKSADCMEYTFKCIEQLLLSK